jgi:hypothetical protein
MVLINFKRLDLVTQINHGALDVARPNLVRVPREEVWLMAQHSFLRTLSKHEILNRRWGSRRPKSIKMLLWDVRRLVRLSPTQRLLRMLEHRGVPLKSTVALEVFGGTGYYHTKDYASRVARVDVWEIDAGQRETLQRNLPMANVTITDSHEEIRTTSKQYSLIVMDNPAGIYETYSEHFDLFPDVFRIAMDAAIIVVNVSPRVRGGTPSAEAHLARRRAFYATDHPERLSFDELVAAYRRLSGEQGFALEWYFFQQRTVDAGLYYLVFKVLRCSA